MSAAGRVTQRRRDVRRPALLAVAAAILAIGALVQALTGRPVGLPVDDPAAAGSPFAGLAEIAAPGPAPAEREPAPVQQRPQAEPSDPLRRVLDEAERQINEQRPEDAIRTLHAAHAQLRGQARAYLLLGRALEARNEPATARDFYEAALQRDPYMADAYWGYATASESLGELDAALGAMRSYLHTEPNPDPDRLRIAQARSALWEWEAQLGRGPWGPTKGIIPGLRPEDMKRDGRGVAIKVPLPGTEKPDGSMKFEIKHQDKFQLFKPD